MAKQYFNFQHEARNIEVDVDDATGALSIEIEGVTCDFSSKQEFAEFYAQSRGVNPENFKNWVLIDEGEEFAYVLRAGTAGFDDEAYDDEEDDYEDDDEDLVEDDEYSSYDVETDILTVEDALNYFDVTGVHRLAFENVPDDLVMSYALSNGMRIAEAVNVLLDNIDLEAELYGDKTIGRHLMEGTLGELLDDEKLDNYLAVAKISGGLPFVNFIRAKDDVWRRGVPVNEFEAIREEYLVFILNGNVYAVFKPMLETELGGGNVVLDFLEYCEAQRKERLANFYTRREALQHTLDEDDETTSNEEGETVVLEEESEEV